MGLLPLAVFQARPTGRRPLGRPRTHWCDYISQQVQERFGIPQAGACYWKKGCLGCPVCQSCHHIPNWIDGWLQWLTVHYSRLKRHTVQSNNYSSPVSTQRSESKCQLTIYFNPSSVFCILHFSWHSYPQACSRRKAQFQHPRHYKQSTVKMASVKSTVLKQE